MKEVKNQRETTWHEIDMEGKQKNKKSNTCIIGICEVEKQNNRKRIVIFGLSFFIIEL